MGWLEELAEALSEEPLNDAEITAILDVARDVAHQTERRYAPLSTYLLGVAVGRERGDRPARLEALAEQTRHLLGVDDADAEE
ncbi:MAG: DUF6457 domain-containing protein [Nitriliruptorales bacterium]|nr:DUF6457 domain-containing protein [Nitriliruptorales bacterium]